MAKQYEALGTLSISRDGKTQDIPPGKIKAGVLSKEEVEEFTRLGFLGPASDDEDEGEPARDPVTEREEAAREYLSGMNKKELAALAAKRGMTITRPEGKKGEPSAAEYIDMLAPHIAAEEE